MHFASPFLGSMSIASTWRSCKNSAGDDGWAAKRLRKRKNCVWQQVTNPFVHSFDREWPTLIDLYGGHRLGVRSSLPRTTKPTTISPKGCERKLKCLCKWEISRSSSSIAITKRPMRRRWTWWYAAGLRRGLGLVAGDARSTEISVGLRNWGLEDVRIS